MPEAHGADPGGLIDPALFPCKSADLNTDTIASGGDQLASMGTNLKSKVEAVETAWTPIAEPYRAPEQESVYALMTPAVDAAGDVSSRFTLAQGHIDTYASSLKTIKTTLSNLETRAAEFRTEALAGYKKYVDKTGNVPEMSLSFNKPNVLVDCTWEEHPPAVEKNDALLAEYNVVLESISTAAATCANSINGLLTGVGAAPVVPVTAEQLDALEEPLPWGSPSKEAEGVQQSIQKGFDNFVGGTFEGLKALAGFDPVTGEWSVANIVTTLGGTADFLVSTAALTLTVPASWLLKETAGKSELTDFLDDRINLAATGWGGMVGWDHQAALAGGDGWAKWKEDGVAAGAEVAFGGLSMIIPGVNAAKIGTVAARVPGMVGKLPDGGAAGVSKTASAFSKAGSFLVGNKPKVTPLSEAKGLTSPVSSAGGHGALDALGESGGPGGKPGTGGGSDSTADAPSRSPKSGGGEDSAGPKLPADPERSPAVGDGSVPSVGKEPVGSPGGAGKSDGGGDVAPASRNPDEAAGSSKPGEDGKAGPDGNSGVDGKPVPDADAPDAPVRDPDEAPAKSGVPASDGGVPNPSAIDKLKAVLGFNSTIPELTDAFKQKVQDRVEAVAARVEAVLAQKVKIAELADEGVVVDPKDLTKEKIKDTIKEQIDQLKEKPELSAAEKAKLKADLEDLEELSWAERDTLTAQVDASKAMGEQAAQDVIASQGAEVIVDGATSGKNSFDQIGLSKDGSTLIVAEAKGGSSTLSESGRKLPDGTRAPQGSTLYFNDVFKNDKALQQYLVEHPDLAAGLADGSVKVSYQLVKANESGVVSVKELVLNPDALDLGLGK